MERRDQFTFYRSYIRSIEQMKQEDQLGVFLAIAYYALDGRKPRGLNKAQKSVYYLIEPVLDSGRKRATAGKIGGSKSKANGKQTVSEKEVEGEKEVEVEKEKEVEDECLKGATGFESFWEQFPVKVSKARAKEAWQALSPEPEVVMAGLKRWKDSRQWNREDGRFIPRAWRWLREKQYLEQPEAESKPIWGATGVLGQAEVEAIQQVMQN